MNLGLVLKNEVDGEVHFVDLQQTPTEVTYKILEEEGFEKQLLAYIRYVKKFDDTSIDDVPDRFNRAVKETMDQFNFSYEQATLSVSEYIDSFLPYSMKEYRRIVMFLYEYTEYKPEFFAM